MIEIDEAIQRVANHCLQLETVACGLEQLAGHVLANAVHSDVDSPPFDKSMMDGYAVISDDIQRGTRELSIVARVMAGEAFAGTIQRGQAVQIMTGAPIPAGADAVVMVEQTSESDDRVTIRAEQVATRQNILPQGIAMKAGQSVFPATSRIRPEDIGVLAEAGASECQVIRRPTLAVIATGDELVDVSCHPTGSQIRNSNGPMLCSMANSLCSSVTNLGIAADRADALADKIAEGLRHDVLVLSGGVSAGVADLVPAILKQADVEQVFHKVKIKPGKPIWFGYRQGGRNGGSLVFGLPGNPVGSMICFHVFVAPALLMLAGRQPTDHCVTARLVVAHKQRVGRTTYWPCQMKRAGAALELTPLDWKGSADQRTLATANCFGVFPGDCETFDVGESIKVFPMA